MKKGVIYVLLYCILFVGLFGDFYDVYNMCMVEDYSKEFVV